MSGIEIAGIVLGAFPLIISAFEHSRTIAKTYNLLTDCEYERGRSLEDIKDEELAFRQVLKILLLPLVTEEVVTEECLALLLADPGGSGWKDKDVEAALRERLGDDVQARYLAVLEELQKALLALLGSLGFDKPKAHEVITSNAHVRIGGDGGASGASKLMTAANQHFQRRKTQLKFALAKWSRDEALAEVHCLNQKLHKLLKRSDKISQLHTTSTRTPSRKVNKALIQY